MSEVEELEKEVDTEEAEVNPIEDLINTVTTQDFSKAGPTFAEIMQDKMADALEQEKIAVADQVFNDAEAEGDIDDEDLEDVSDEDIEDAIEETDEDDKEE